MTKCNIFVLLFETFEFVNNESIHHSLSGRVANETPKRKSGSRYDPAVHHRRSIRLKGYDYAQPGRYFITLNCQNRRRLFGEIRNGEMILNEYGRIIHDEWLHTSLIRPETSIEAFVIMPDHFHAIIQINQASGPKRHGPAEFASPSRTIGAIIRGFKGTTTKKIKERYMEQMRAAENLPMPDDNFRNKIDMDQKIWQRDYYEIIIRDERAYQNITQYIINNPRKAEMANRDSAKRANRNSPNRNSEKRANCNSPNRNSEKRANCNSPNRNSEKRANRDSSNHNSPRQI